MSKQVRELSDRAIEACNLWRWSWDSKSSGCFGNTIHRSRGHQRLPEKHDTCLRSKTRLAQAEAAAMAVRYRVEAEPLTFAMHERRHMHRGNLILLSDHSPGLQNTRS